jgi:hypothetical protein
LVAPRDLLVSGEAHAAHDKLGTGEGGRESANMMSILTPALITGVVGDTLALFDFDRFFSSAGERSFRDCLDLDRVIFSD